MPRPSSGYFWGSLVILDARLCAKLLQSCPTLCDPADWRRLGSSVHGVLQQERWTGLPCPRPGHLPDPGMEPVSLKAPALAGGFFTTSATWEASVITDATSQLSHHSQLSLSVKHHKRVLGLFICRSKGERMG